MYQIDGQIPIGEITLNELIPEHEVSFYACIHKIRRVSGFAFVFLRTGRYILQAIHNSECKTPLNGLFEGSYIKLTGIVKDEPRALYGYEIELKEFDILSKPIEKYPLPISDKALACTLETNLLQRSVSLRHPNERAIFKISEGVKNGFRDFMISESFTEINTPKICSFAPEGGTNVFKLKYFGNDAVLAQSPQIYKQMCIAYFDRVFEIAPSYRADKHNSTRHLNEFISLDFEMGFIRNIDDIMQTETAILKHIINYLNTNYKTELELLEVTLPQINNIPSVTFYEALEILGKTQPQDDLDPTDEMKLCEYSKENFKSEFIFVTQFPQSKRPFYVMNSTDNAELSQSFDLLFKGLEISSGGQRIHDYDTQLEKLKSRSINENELQYFLEAHKYGLPPHGGAAIGLERFVMKLLGLENIKQASLFPRDMHHLTP